MNYFLFKMYAFYDPRNLISQGTKILSCIFSLKFYSVRPYACISGPFQLALVCGVWQSHASVACGCPVVPAPLLTWTSFSVSPFGTLVTVDVWTVWFVYLYTSNTEPRGSSSFPQFNMSCSSPAPDAHVGWLSGRSQEESCVWRLPWAPSLSL